MPQKPEDEQPEKAKKISRKLEVQQEKLRYGLRLFLLIFTVVYLAMFIVGSVKFKECPLNNKIPFYLLIAGLMGVLSKVFSFVEQKLEGMFLFLKKLETTLYTAEFIWMIMGSYWVYSEYKPNFDPQKGLYCDKVTYHLAFWTITIHYTLLLMVLLFCTLAGLYMCLLQSLAEKNVKSSQEEVV